jgi:DNA-binding transcriptional MerR regulator
MDPRRALPEKKYFKIGEVADLVGVEPHVLRYWETQFPQIRPHKARSGHRLYRRREVEALLVIRELLHVQRFTIAGARQALRQPGGISALLPRFFEAPAGFEGPAMGTAGARVALGAGAGLDATDPDGAPVIEELDAADELPSLPAVLGPGPEVVEIEAEGLEGEALAAAMEREAMERAVRRGPGAEAGPPRLAEVEVEAVPEAQVEAQVEAVARRSPGGAERGRPAPGAASRAGPALPLPDSLPDSLPGGLSDGLSGGLSGGLSDGLSDGLGMGALPLSGARRALLEGALADARAILGLLDREEAHDRLHA